MTELEQLKADAKLMVEALQAGPSRYDQMTSEIYAIYDRHGFSRQHHSPEYVYSQLVEAVGHAKRRQHQIGFDPANPYADHTATDYLNENGNITEV